MRLLFFIISNLIMFPIFAQSLGQHSHLINSAFEENFDDNSNEWIKDPAKDSAVSAIIDNGMLKIINKKTVAIGPIDLNKILTTLKILKFRFHL